VVRWVRSGDGSASGRGGEEVGDRDLDSMERYPMSSILIPRSNSDSVSPKIFFGSSQEGNMRKFLSDVFDFYIPTPSCPMSGSVNAKSQSLFVLLCR
jgi:hypothetical protein